MFEELMGRRYPGDFMACRPWGRQGDRKNDGYLSSAHTLFQVYGPNEIAAAATVKKIEEDFSGAKEHWQNYFKRWIFVHNAHDQRLPPDVIKALADLREQNPQVDIETWGYPELLIEFRKLGLADLESWMGAAPTVEDKARIGFAEIQAVVEHLKLSPFATNASPRPVPFGKIEFNLLPEAVASYLKMGMGKAPLVASYFSSCRNPLEGERVAAAFKARYAELRGKQPPLHPHDIWGELDDWAGGNITKKPIEKLAITAVLAWLFDSCDIFEEPPPRGAAAS
ncbi:MAG: ABC-three component system protein [Accumulibacter sp.]|uniref:ABC-three component system protein n=1 Tax=Accumulibacter sp. TaxID=2053492 RepID=UPI002FC3B393